MRKQKQKGKIIRLSIELGIIILMILSAFNIPNSIYVNPGDSIQYQIDSPLETYTWSVPYNVSQIIISGLNDDECEQHMNYSLIIGTLSVYGDKYTGQTFTVGSVGVNVSYTIQSVGFYAHRIGTAGTCTVNLYATTSGKPTGSILATGTFDGDTLPNSSSYQDSVYIEVDLSNDFRVTPGIQYAFVVNKTGGSILNNVVRIRDKAGSIWYPNGDATTSSDAGSSWSIQNADAYFRVVGSYSYIGFNNTFFNISSNAPIQIEISHIDEDIFNPADTNDVLLNFTVINPASDTWFNISGFEPTSIYNVYTDPQGVAPATLLDTVTANASGIISWFDIPSWNDAYVIYWVEPPSNNPPVLNNPYPTNNSVDISAAGSPINILAIDPDGDNMTTDVWTNASGSWIQVAGFNLWNADQTNWSKRFIHEDVNDDGNFNFQDALLYFITEGNQTNGTRLFVENLDSDPPDSLNISVTDDWGMTTPLTRYWWSVNCSDGTDWTNSTYSFTTDINYPPVISNPYPASGTTDIPVTGSPINIYVNDTDGDTMLTTVWSNHTGSWVQYAGWNLYAADPQFYEGFMNDTGDTWGASSLTSYTSSSGLQNNGTRGFYFNNASVTKEWGMISGNTKYWWRVDVTDGNDSVSEIFNFTTGAVPAVLVETDDATDVGVTLGTLHGELTYDENNASCLVRFEYGTTQSMIFETVNQTKDEGETFSKTISLSIAGTTFYYQAVADNGFIVVNGSMVIFVSKPNHLQNIAITNISDGFTISWDDPISGNLNNSVLVFNNDHTPTSITDGTIIYNETMVGFSDSYNHVGLTRGLTYYYSVWSLSMFHPIYQYSDTYISASEYFIDDPNVTTNSPTGIMETNITLHGTLVDDGGAVCTTWFEYGTTINYGNDTRYNISYNFVNSTTSTDTSKRPELQFNSDYWIKNTTIGADTEIGIFLNATGLWDNVSSVFRYNGDILGWSKTLPPSFNTLNDITSYGRYRFVITNNTVPFILSWDNQIDRITGYDMEQHLYIRPGQLYHYRAGANNSKNTTYGDNEIFLSRPKSTIRFPGGDYPWIYINGTYSPLALNLTWIKGMGANNTYIERNTVSSWDRGEGTTVYNDTGTTYNDTGLTMGSLYYYQAWGFANWSYNGTTYWQYSSDYSSNSNTTANVDPPYNGISSYDTGTLTLNLTWTSGNNSDMDIVIQNNNSYSTSPSDGWIRQNSTVNSSNYFNTSLTYNTFFTVWSYNVTANIYSAVGLDIPWGAIEINVFDENSPWIPIIDYTLFITNTEGDETYYVEDVNNPVVISFESIPFGEDTIIQINHPDYEQRVWHVNLFVNTYYNYTFYLPSIEAPTDGDDDPPAGGGGDCLTKAYTDSITVTNPAIDAIINLTYTLDDIIEVHIFNKSFFGSYGGWVPVPSDKFTATSVNVTIDNSVLDANTTIARASYYYEDCDTYEPPALYYIRVVESYETEFGISDRSVENAKVTFQRYINTTDSYEDVSILLTDANGYVDLYLMPGVIYKVIITKDGYVTKSSSYQPAPPNQYGQTVEKVFRISHEVPDATEPSETRDDVFRNIEWILEPSSVQHHNQFTVWFNITSSDCKLEWYRMIVWYYNNSNTTWYQLYNVNQTNTCGGELNYSIPNVTGRYAIECFYKKTNFTEYECFQQGSLIMFFSHLKAGLEEFPDFAYYIILIVIMILVMGFFYWYFATGIVTGYIGLIIFAIGLLMKPIEIPVGVGDPVSGWWIFAVTFIMYTVGLYLWSKI